MLAAEILRQIFAAEFANSAGYKFNNIQYSAY
jgi:hypothetical protein